MNISTILFDLDGTLVDTAADLAYALNAVLGEYHKPHKSYEDIRPLVSFGGKALIKFGFDCDESDVDFAQKHQRILHIYTDNIAQYSKPFTGVLDLIKVIKRRGLFWGVVTNKPENLTYLLLQKLELNPDVVVCGDTLKQNKPHPAPLLYACAQLAVKAQQCLFVGDDKNDMLAGNSANMTTIAATYGYGKVREDWAYDGLINTPKELEKWVL